MFTNLTQYAIDRFPQSLTQVTFPGQCAHLAKVTSSTAMSAQGGKVLKLYLFRLLHSPPLPTSKEIKKNKLKILNTWAT